MCVHTPGANAAHHKLKDCTRVHITCIYSEIGGRLRVAQRASAAHGTTQGHFAEISQPRKQNQTTRSDFEVQKRRSYSSYQSPAFG